MNYIIRNISWDAGTYWNNENGWGDLASATVFSLNEIETLPLPRGGDWTPCPVPPSLISAAQELIAAIDFDRGLFEAKDKLEILLDKIRTESD